MKYFMLLLLLTQWVWADSLKIKVIPKEPVFNEAFEVLFTISSQSDSDEEPVINFEPIGIEVLAKSSPSVSTRTSFINGRMSFERTITYKYEMISPNAGYAFLRKINVEIGSKKLRHPNMNIRILQKARKPKQLFLEAEVSKEQYYIGESIVVRYYLYNAENMSLNSTDVKRFPKLDKFLKRYHQEKSVPERVSKNGQIYVRRVIYTSQLYANTPGSYFIDPLSLNVSYTERGRSNLDRFGFGFSMGRLKKRSLRSKQIKLNIVPVPTENLPGDYTGLVGKHDFQLKTNKSKYLANEPIELELSVSGQGALELFEAPKILSDPLIEEFETVSDLKINPNLSALKRFEYTYLGRGDVKLPQRKIGFSYFDVETGKFKKVELDLPPIEVVGIGTIQPATKIETQDKKKPIASVVEEKKVELTFEPLYKTMNSFVYYSKHLFLMVGSLLIIFLSYLAIKQLQAYRNRTVDIFEQIEKHGLTYARLYRVISLLGTKGSMSDMINQSDLPKETKRYFSELTEKVNANYDENNSKAKFKIKKKYFQDFERFIKKKEHEDNFLIQRV